MTPTGTRTPLLLFAFAATLSALPSQAAGPVAVAPAFKLTPCAACAVTNPAVAGAPAGAFMTAFDSKSLADGPSVQARNYRPTGLAAGVPFRVQAAATPPQFDAAVASNSAGVYVAAWSTVDPATRNSDVWAQRYDATGKAAGTAIRVNDDGGLPHILDTRPAVAMAADGGFVVAWIRIVEAPAGDGANQIWSRRFAAAGTPVSTPVQLSSGLVNGDRPTVCIDTLKRGVVEWTNGLDQGPFEPSLNGIAVRRVALTGVPLGAALVVAQPRANEAHGAVSCGAGGTFVVAWQTDQSPAKDSADIVAQRFTPNATRSGAAFVVNTGGTDQQRTPAIFHDAAGNFVIAWQDRAPGHAGIYGQRFSGVGARLGTTFTIATATPSRTPPSAVRLAAAGPANAFVAVWIDYTGAFGRRFKIAP